MSLPKDAGRTANSPSHQKLVKSVENGITSSVSCCSYDSQWGRGSLMRPIIRAGSLLMLYVEVFSLKLGLLSIVFSHRLQTMKHTSLIWKKYVK